uniref:Beta-hexosaminidase n=1 Tax=Hordeum vulgare subsp. vulgare TaxID=112509 RepID=A0A8I6WGU7_HORVV
MPPELLACLFLALVAVSASGAAAARRHPTPANSTATGNPVYIWPLPKNFTSGTRTLAVDPDLALDPRGPGGGASAVAEAFGRYRSLIFSPWAHAARPASAGYDVATLTVVVASADETLELGVDESYTIYIAVAGGANSIVSGATIEANTIYGAIRGLETFSQLCVFNYDTKNVEVRYAPWYIQDEPRFAFRGLMLDTSRHYLPVDVIKQVIDSMSFSKLNVLHWHIIDEQSFPLEIPSYPNLWKGSYSKSERYTVEDARYIVSYAKKRGIHVMAEIDVPGHAESWGNGYPKLWPSLSYMRKIFPFGLFHLGGDEVYTGCWNLTPHVKQWLDERNMTTKEAYKYFVLKAQEIAIDLNWIPVNWEETFNSFGESLNPRTVVHNWLGPGVCPKVVAKGLRCIMSNQGVWYLDHLDVPWEQVYTAEPLAGINDTAQQKLVLGGEVCMWGETADTSDVQQTIWPRAAAAAERMWSQLEAISAQDLETTVLARLHYFRCLLNHRGIAAAPVTNFYARRPPIGPGSCFLQ